MKSAGGAQPGGRPEEEPEGKPMAEAEAEEEPEDEMILATRPPEGERILRPTSLAVRQPAGEASCALKPVLTLAPRQAVYGTL